MIKRLIVDLEDCLGRVDDSGHKLAGAYLSAAIDKLKSSTGQGSSLPGSAQTAAEAKSNVFRFN